MRKNIIIKMACVVYEYTFTKPRKDGTIGVYKKRMTYQKKIKNDNVSDEQKIEIKRRLSDGVSKKRICTDYNISFNKLQKIIGCEQAK